MNRPPVQANFDCNVCGDSFPSRTKLFDHVKAEGHALAEPQAGKGGKKASGKRKGR